VPRAVLRSLLTNLIDYAGTFPPASLPLAEAAQKFRSHRARPESWILNRIVLGTTEIIDPDWRVSLLTDTEPAALPQIETLETKRPQKLSLPTYCEVPLDQVPPGAFAKIRTTTPTVNQLAEFLQEAAARRIPFKATAGLHHPVRSIKTGMHGFLNVFIAAAAAWHGASNSDLIDILNQEDPHQLLASLETLTTAEIETARRDFAHSFGSCSFDEPIDDLHALGLLS
jgi:hypothetical protein